MLKRIFTLLLAVLFVSAYAQKPTYTVMKASVPPVMDGIIDEVWNEASAAESIEVPVAEETPTLGESGETTFKVLWDDDYIYVLLVVADDDFYPSYMAGGNSWDSDKPEIYLDCNFELVDGFGPSTGGSGHYQVAPEFTALNIDGTAETESNGVIHAFLVDDPSYVAEYSIPFSWLLDNQGVGVDKTAEIGFDVTIIDNDEGGSKNRAVWSSVGDIGNSWVNMDGAGIITLDGAEPGVFIESIDLAGEDITENNMEMQINATILPEDASNKVLKWTVENTTGRATINSNGVLTPIIDGEVIVTAAATDGSYEDATITVNISGQLVSVHELNLVRNGYFDLVNADGTPAMWNTGGNGGDALPTVVDGAVKMDPKIGGVNPWDYTLTQQDFGCNTTDMYSFSFLVWSEAPRMINVDFEDSNNGYNRYGESTHPFSYGESDWTFEATPEKQHVVFDVQFTELVENTNESLQFMFGVSDTVVYIDSVVLVRDADLALVSDYNPVTSIVVTSEGDAADIEIGTTLQFSAAVLPADADYPSVRWSVMGEATDATIDANGLLTAGAMAGTVMVYAKASDDSQQMGMMEITISFPDGIAEKNLVKINAYPNPADNELMVELSAANQTVSIYNSLGKLMEEVQMKGTQHQFDISSYAKGIYFVKSGSSVVKFVK